MSLYMNEVTSIRELEFHKVINEQGKLILDLEDRLAFMKFKHDEDLTRIDKLEEELCGRDNALYEINKRMLALEFERKNYIAETRSDDFEILKLRETVESLKQELQKKEIEVKTRDIHIINLDTEIKFRDAISATA